MAELKGLMLSLTQIHMSPRALMIAANRIIAANLDSRSFITMTYAIFDLEARTMTYARAGHTPLIHLPARGARRQARLLTTGGMVLGLKLDNGEKFAELLEEVTLPLETGDLFVLFTDGITEAMNAAEDLFGEDRLGALVEEHADLPFEELRERIIREVRAFAGEPGPHDDMTLILLKVDAIGLPPLQRYLLPRSPSHDPSPSSSCLHRLISRSLPRGRAPHLRTAHLVAPVAPETLPAQPRRPPRSHLHRRPGKALGRGAGRL